VLSVYFGLSIKYPFHFKKSLSAFCPEVRCLLSRGYPLTRIIHMQSSISPSLEMLSQPLFIIDFTGIYSPHFHASSIWFSCKFISYFSPAVDPFIQSRGVLRYTPLDLLAEILRYTTAIRDRDMLGICTR
jgi:hypothetical protein